ncbi:MAG TPA: hypothetical protein VKS22_12790 [Candidatus Binataceae bacterium]|nr:hypothetical protein [Candidatus Binataceae bacterium]
MVKTCDRKSFLGLLTLILLLIAVRRAVAQTSLFLTDAPLWTHYLCDSSEPDPNGSASLQGLHCYPSLTVPGGATLTVTNLLSAAGAPQNSPRGALLAFVNGPCSVLGTINATASNTGYSNGGGSGGGGGGAAANAGQVGLFSAVFGNGAFVTTAAGGLGGKAELSGAAGSSPTLSSQKWIWNTGLALGVPGGSSGGAGGIGQGVAAGGGAGGGAVVLVCATIDFEGTINVNGGAGATGSQGGGGGGGGGGGLVMMAAPSYTANSGTVNLDGGAGGAGDSGAGAGGGGGNGWFKQFTLN